MSREEPTTAGEANEAAEDIEIGKDDLPSVLKCAAVRSPDDHA